MKIAFLNLCHTDAELVARAARKLNKQSNFGMFVHVDLKSDISVFEKALCDIPRVSLLTDRTKVFWGGFNAVTATILLLKAALKASENYDYFVILQNLDYPTRSNAQIMQFFEQHNGKEFIRGCNIAKTKDWHYSRKYKIFNKRDDDFYLEKHSSLRMKFRYLHMLSRRVGTVFSNGIIKEGEEKFNIYYGAAQWAVSRSCAQYFVDFYESHPKFNREMQHIQFPDEEYFHTVFHNSHFKTKCIKYDEPVQRWLVNWRNLHYYEYPKEITVFNESNYDTVINEDALFIRKVRTGFSDKLLDMIDEKTIDL